MSRQIVSIYSSFGIEGYGLCIAIGLLIVYALLARDQKRKRLVDDDHLSAIINLTILAGIFGGRILFVLTNFSSMESWFDCIRLWDGGFSLLGAQIGIVLGLIWYCVAYKISFLKLVDIISFYAPLMIAISRIGCFWAGCCFGTLCRLPFAHVYTDPTCLAPLHIPLHPAQLYHSGILFFIFITLIVIRKKFSDVKPGLMTGLSFLLMGFERFFVDFFRGDREFVTLFSLSVSIHQILSLAIVAFSISLLLSIFFNKSRAVTIP